MLQLLKQYFLNIVKFGDLSNTFEVKFTEQVFSHYQFLKFLLFLIKVTK